jgi:peptidoglycan/LPS O-acetylase OafA/YrhL
VRSASTGSLSSADIWVAKSYLTKSSLLDFLVKRVARILPAFVVVTIVSIALFGPIAHSPLAELGLRDWRHVAIFMFPLQPPPVPAFSGLLIPALNGAMWTIACEFRCYCCWPDLASSEFSAKRRRPHWSRQRSSSCRLQTSFPTSTQTLNFLARWFLPPA